MFPPLFRVVRIEAGMILRESYVSIIARDWASLDSCPPSLQCVSRCHNSVTNSAIASPSGWLQQRNCLVICLVEMSFEDGD